MNALLFVVLLNFWVVSLSSSGEAAKQNDLLAK